MFSFSGILLPLRHFGDAKNPLPSARQEHDERRLCVLLLQRPDHQHNAYSVGELQLEGTKRGRKNEGFPVCETGETLFFISIFRK